MADLLARLWYFAYNIVLVYFIHPGASQNVNSYRWTIPYIITNNPLLLLFFGITILFVIIRIFYKLRRIF